MIARLFLLLGLSLWLAGCAGAAEPRVERVLFVGNSFTYYNNSLHMHYRALRRAHAPDGPPPQVRALTLSGGRLPEHAGALPPILASAAWDTVILQGHSRDPLDADTAGPFRAAAERYARAIRAGGAQPALFMTWAYRDRPDMLAPIAAAYERLGAELGATVVPVGRAFALVTERHADIDLYAADGRHPSLAGTYLAACTFFEALHAASVVGNAYDAGLDPETVRALQIAAREVVAERAEH